MESDAVEAVVSSIMSGSIGVVEIFAFHLHVATQVDAVPDLKSITIENLQKAQSQDLCLGK